MEKPIVVLIEALMAFVLVASALPVPFGICAATDGDQQGEGGAEVLQKF